MGTKWTIRRHGLWRVGFLDSEGADFNKWWMALGNYADHVSKETATTAPVEEKQVAVHWDNESENTFSISSEGQQPKIKGYCGNYKVQIFLDTGSSVSLIKRRALNSIQEKNKRTIYNKVPKILGAGGVELRTHGAALVELRIQKAQVDVPCIVVEDASTWEGDILLGIRAQRELGMIINLQENVIKGLGRDIPIDYEINSLNSTWKLRATGDVSIPPNHIVAIACKPPPIGTQCRICFFEPNGLYASTIEAGLIDFAEPIVLVTNTTNEWIHCKKDTSLGMVSKLDTANIISTRELSGDDNTIENKREELRELINCPEQFREKLLDVLVPYRPQTVAKKGEPLGRTHLMEMDIELLPGTKPIALAPYRTPHSQLDTLNTQLDNLIAHRVMGPTMSPYAAPVVLVKKADGTLRICCDYRKLNSQTVGNEFPLPNIAEIINKLGEAKFFSSIDLLQAYHQVPLTDRAKALTAFRTADRHLQYEVAPFGLKNMPSVFQRLMNMLFAAEARVRPNEIPIIAYLDDILIASKDEESHLKRIKYVLDRLQYANLKLRIDKCQFFKTKINFLGHVISADGYAPQSEKIRAIKEFPKPNNVKAVRAFLGLAGYYRTFIQNFSVIAEPLSRLIKKDVDFVWSDEQEVAFKKLCDALTGDTILQYPNFNKEFFVECDASGIGIGCVITQVSEGKRKPVAYSSRLLRRAEVNYTTTEKEALSIIAALQKHRYILLGYKITVVTDHQPLLGLFRSTLPPGRLGRWALLAQEFDIKVVYRPGRQNNVPDALSRYPVSEVQTVNSTQVIGKMVEPIAPDELRDAQRADDQYRDVIGRLSKLPERTAEGEFHLRDRILHHETEVRERGVTRNKVKVVIPESLVSRVLQLNHDSRFCGHGGVEITLRKLKSQFFIKGLRQKVERYVATCPICLKTKRKYTKDCEIRKYPLPNYVFEQVHLDLLGPIPVSTNGHRHIMVITDRLSRYTIAEPIPDRTAETIVEALHRRLVVEYTTPKVLLSDNAKEFISDLMAQMCKYYGIRKVHCASYHPAANGLVERANGKILAVLRTSISQRQNDWDIQVRYAQTAINCAYHHTIKETPHFMVFLQDKVLPYDILIKELPITPGSRGDYVENAMYMANIAVDCARKNLEEEQAKWVTKVNEGREAPKIKVGMRVYIKLHTVKVGLAKKLQNKYKGPYRVLELMKFNKFRVRSLVTGKEEQIHNDHIKIVPEYCVEREEVPRARTPFPHMVGQDCMAEVVDDPETRAQNDTQPTQASVEGNKTQINDPLAHTGFVPHYERPNTRSASRRGKR